MSMLVNSYVFASPSTDPYFADVVSLLHFDGADGSTTFVDQKGLTWTAAGSAQLDTSQFRFGGASLQLVRANNADYISTPHDADFSADTDFTCEMWLRPDAFVAGLEYLATKRNTGTGREWSFYLVGGALTLAVFDATGNPQVNPSGPSLVSSGTWHHVAWTRAGNTYRLFLDGIVEATVTVAFTYGYNTDPITIGNDPASPGRFFDGHIDDFRVTRGVARYTANFTPPSAPFPDS